METAATYGTLGIDPLYFLRCKDDTELLLVETVADRMLQLRKTDQENLAIVIANKVNELFKK